MTRPRQSFNIFKWIFVGIGIAAILFFAYTFLYVLPKCTKAYAREPRCSKNLKSIAKAVLLYASENDGQTPNDLYTCYAMLGGTIPKATWEHDVQQRRGPMPAHLQGFQCQGTPRVPYIYLLRGITLPTDESILKQLPIAFDASPHPWPHKHQRHGTVIFAKQPSHGSPDSEKLVAHGLSNPEKLIDQIAELGVFNHVEKRINGKTIHYDFTTETGAYTLTLQDEHMMLLDQAGNDITGR